jgi:hypothetical protein
MAWNHNRGRADFRKVGFRCANLAIDAASGRVVDKRIVAIPERVSCVQNISFGKAYVLVGNSRKAADRAGAAASLINVVQSMGCADVHWGGPAVF